MASQIRPQSFWFVDRGQVAERAAGGAPRTEDQPSLASAVSTVTTIGVLFGCLGRKIDGPGLPGILISYQGHVFPRKGHLWFQLLWRVEAPEIWMEHTLSFVFFGHGR